MITVDLITRIWMDTSGDSIEIGEDSDGLDMVEIRHRDSGGEITSRVSFVKEAAPEIAKGIMRFLEEDSRETS